MNEFWECQSCLFVGSLNMHGKCPRCDSAAVMSQEVLIVKVLENERKRREAKSAERIAYGWKTRKAKAAG